MVIFGVTHPSRSSMRSSSVMIPARIISSYVSTERRQMGSGGNAASREKPREESETIDIGGTSKIVPRAKETQSPKRNMLHVILPCPSKWRKKATVPHHRTTAKRNADFR